MQAEVVEPARARVEPHAGPDEVQQILPARGLEKEHALVRKGGLEAEDVDIEALGTGEVAGLERQVAEHGQLRIRGLTSIITRSSTSSIDRKSTRLNSSHLGISYA